jgi:hypothetical protein
MKKVKRVRKDAEYYRSLSLEDLTDAMLKRPWWLPSLAGQEYDRRFQLWLREREAEPKTKEQHPCQQNSLQSLVPTS